MPGVGGEVDEDCFMGTVSIWQQQRLWRWMVANHYNIKQQYKYITLNHTFKCGKDGILYITCMLQQKAVRKENLQHSLKGPIGPSWDLQVLSIVLPFLLSSLLWKPLRASRSSPSKLMPAACKPPLFLWLLFLLNLPLPQRGPLDTPCWVRSSAILLSPKAFFPALTELWIGRYSQSHHTVSTIYQKLLRAMDGTSIPHHPVPRAQHRAGHITP